MQEAPCDQPSGDGPAPKGGRRATESRHLVILIKQEVPPCCGSIVHSAPYGVSNRNH